MAESQPVVAGTEDGLDANGHGHVKGIAHGDAVEAGRSYAENFKGIAIQRQTPSNHGQITGETALPEGVADACSRRGAAGLDIRWTKQPPENRLDAKYTKEIAADADTLCFADFPARG